MAPTAALPLSCTEGGIPVFTQVMSSIHKYNSNFGFGEEPTDFSSVDFNFIYSSNPIAACSRHVLPLLVIVGIVLASPSLPGSIGDVHLAIPSAALLTLIFLNQSCQTEIPPLSYTTFLGYLYIKTNRQYRYLFSDHRHHRACH